MNRTYMQDITPGEEPIVANDSEPRMTPERSIRNIEPSQARMRMTRTMPARPPVREAPPNKRSRWGIWVAAVISLLALIAVTILVLYPKTIITIVPRSQSVPFDPSAPFTAYPKDTAADGAISYTTVTQTFDDSVSVEANGTEYVEEQATGKVTVYNNYSTSPVRLIKNTRFETPAGLVFRTPSSIVVPGKNGSAPGSIEITVFADQAGPEYNVPAVDRFTLPGLKSTPDMFTGVYARSTSAFSGGYKGERPAIAEAELNAARAALRDRLMEQATGLVGSVSDGSIAFSALASITYETLPPTTEEGGGVRINERAVVILPVFDEHNFAQAVGRAVSANAEGHTIDIRFANGMSAQASSTLAQAEYGIEPLVFSLSGMGQLIWQVDIPGLAEALAGKSETAFESIVSQFPAVDEARARITPLWRSSFPEDPTKMDIVIEEPPQPF